MVRALRDGDEENARRGLTSNLIDGGGEACMRAVLGLGVLVSLSWGGTEGRYVADSGMAPMTIQINHGGGGLHGVYKVDGDTLTIALADRADPRPTGFATPPPPGVIVCVFHRVKDD
jgi:hypothetical protein